MLVWEFIREMQVWSTQIQDTLWLSEATLYTYLNNVLTLIYAWKDWSWTLTDETISEVSNVSLFTTSRRVFKPYMVLLDNKLYERTMFPWIDLIWWYQYYIKNNIIKTTKEWKDLRIIYHKWPPKYSVTDSTSELDIPEDFILPLKFLFQRAIYVTGFEQWASMSNQFWQMFLSAIERLEGIYGFNIWVKWFDLDNLYLNANR